MLSASLFLLKIGLPICSLHISIWILLLTCLFLWVKLKSWKIALKSFFFILSCISSSRMLFLPIHKHVLSFPFLIVLSIFYQYLIIFSILYRTFTFFVFILYFYFLIFLIFYYCMFLVCSIYIYCGEFVHIQNTLVFLFFPSTPMSPCSLKFIPFHVWKCSIPFFFNSVLI